jgi:hypothetical protein
MQHKKKIKYCLLFVMLLSAPLAVIKAGEPSSFAGNALFDDPQVNIFLDEHQGQTIIFRQTPAEHAQDIIDVLLGLGAIDILQEDLICRTNPLNKRNILDYPIFFPQKLDYAFNWTLGAHFFYNQTSRAFFSQFCDNISTTFAFKSQSLLEKITQSIPKIRELFKNFTVDPISVLALFENGTAQERRLGFIFHGERQFRFAHFRFFLPVMYLERNFYFTDEERSKLESQLGALSPDQQAIFQKQHLISDRIGIGDTRLELDFSVTECEEWAIRVGALTTIPTAVAFAKGFIGSGFDKCCPRPTFNFEDLFACIPAGDPTPEQLNNARDCTTNLLRCFLLQTMDTFSANVLETNLGYEGHFGLGPLLRTRHSLDMIIHRPWASQVTWLNYLNVQYLFQADEKRFFIERPNIEEFNSRDFNDPSQSISNLAFLDEQVVNRVIPFCFTTTVYPGFVVEWVSKFQFEFERWGFNYGTDFWLQGKEKICNIRAPIRILNNLDINAAVLPLAIQGKLFATALYKIERETRDWVLSFNGDYTFASTGIGKDFTLAFNFETNF